MIRLESGTRPHPGRNDRQRQSSVNYKVNEDLMFDTEIKCGERFAARRELLSVIG